MNRLGIFKDDILLGYYLEDVSYANEKNMYKMVDVNGDLQLFDLYNIKRNNILPTAVYYDKDTSEYFVIENANSDNLYVIPNRGIFKIDVSSKPTDIEDVYVIVNKTSTEEMYMFESSLEFKAIKLKKIGDYNSGDRLLFRFVD